MNLFKNNVIIDDNKITEANSLKTNSLNKIATININGKNQVFDNSFFIKGFIDSHAHIMHTGKQLNGLDLSECKSDDECIEKCINYKNRQGEWLVARGWNQELWEEKKYPSKEKLDKFFPDTPVFLTRIDGHAYWMNSKAFEVCDIDKNTISPKGGDILLDKNGELSGIILDNASELVYKHIPELSYNDKKQYILDAIDEFMKYGVTEIHDMDVDIDLIDIYKELERENKLKIKIISYIRGFDNKYLEKLIIPYKSKMLNIIGLKFYMDGAIGSRGAALHEPYNDDLNNKGILLEEVDKFYQKIKTGVENNWQIATHAIGDYAMSLVLDIYERIRNEFPNAHLRIEHAQMIKREDLIRLRENNIFCSVQPLFAKSDENMVFERIGDRVNNSYLWKTFIDNKIIIGASSDAPIESISVIESLKVLTDTDISWQESEKLTFEEAFELYTKNNMILSGSINNHHDYKDIDENFTLLEGKENDLNTWKIKGIIANGCLHLI